MQQDGPSGQVSRIFFYPRLFTIELWWAPNEGHYTKGQLNSE